MKTVLRPDWKWQLDRAIRYAVSDSLSVVCSHVNALEKTALDQSKAADPCLIAPWQRYLSQLWRLHHHLLALPDLETALWIDDAAYYDAPQFMSFSAGIADARSKVARMLNWLQTLPADPTHQRQAYEQQLRWISQELLNLVGPNHPQWGQLPTAPLPSKAFGEPQFVQRTPALSSVPS